MTTIGRLTKQKDFTTIRRRGRTTGSQHIVLRSIPLDDDRVLATIVVSQKVARKATVRNRIKRRLRAALREHTTKLKTGYAFIIIARIGSDKADYQTLKKTLAQTLKRARLTHT